MARKGSRKGDNSWIWAIGTVAVLAIGGAAWYLMKPLPEVPNLQSFPSEGQEHVAPPAVVTYKTDPPTSGPHYPTWVRSGFYREPQSREQLVHNLEHGQVVIYYSPQQTPPEVIRQLEGYARAYTGQWDGVVVVPREQKEEVILTAWRQMLVQEKFNARYAENFLDRFRGRGPENPVR